MFLTDDPTAVSTLPTPSAVGTPGYFSDGNPLTGTPATILRAEFMNMIMMELQNVVTGAGLTPSKTTNTQVLLALQSLVAAAPNRPLIGSMRNGAMALSSAGAIATFTADQIVVGTSLTGSAYQLDSFSKTVNLATTGAGGMDTGSAPTSGFIALYAIYNVSTATAALLAVNSTSSVAAEIYAGTHMPSGYTASALISVWRTNSSGLMVIGTHWTAVRPWS